MKHTTSVQHAKFPQRHRKSVWSTIARNYPSHDLLKIS